jgi:predicted alpha/beta-fold hydrolase
MGISLGGTKLLNALLADGEERRAAGLASDGPLLDGLVCISSPLDLEACSRQIEQPRNRVYQHWLLRRLVQQTLADPFGVSPAERAALEGRGPLGRLRSIRDFDAAITAPRWGYPDVATYYRQASPIHGLLAELELERERDQEAARFDRPSPLPPTLLVHAADDPWVPVGACEQLARKVQLAQDQAPPEARQPLQVLITAQGGHNGFHARCDNRAGAPGNWGDRLTALWMRRLVGVETEGRVA